MLSDRQLVDEAIPESVLDQIVENLLEYAIPEPNTSYFEYTVKPRKKKDSNEFGEPSYAPFLPGLRRLARTRWTENANQRLRRSESRGVAVLIQDFENVVLGSGNPPVLDLLERSVSIEEVKEAIILAAARIHSPELVKMLVGQTSPTNVNQLIDFNKTLIPKDKHQAQRIKILRAVRTACHVVLKDLSEPGFDPIDRFIESCRMAEVTEGLIHVVQKVLEAGRVERVHARTAWIRDIGQRINPAVEFTRGDPGDKELLQRLDGIVEAMVSLYAILSLYVSNDAEHGIRADDESDLK